MDRTEPAYSLLQKQLGAIVRRIVSFKVKKIAVGRSDYHAKATGLMMLPRNPTIRSVCLCSSVLLTALALSDPAAVYGEIEFFLQREGSEDVGFDQFVETARDIQEQDFEGPEFAPDGVSVPVLGFVDLEFELFGELAGPFTPRTFSSTEFDAEGRFFGRALFAGIGLTASVSSYELPHAVGMWLFDDKSTFDAVYLIGVTETDGSMSWVILENEIARNSKGHEIEGFVGVTSNIGIVEMTITPLDDVTGDVVPNFLEIDHWLVVSFPDAGKIAKGIRKLDLDIFDGPNDNANRGQREAMAKRADQAADLQDQGNFSGAVAALESVLAQFHGRRPNQDGVTDSEEASVIIADVHLLVSYLAHR